MKPNKPKSIGGESFAELRQRSRTVSQEKPTRTVVTTGKAAERERQAMERRVAAKPQRKADGGAVSGPWQMPPAPFTPLPKMKFPGSRWSSGAPKPLPVVGSGGPSPLLTKLSDGTWTGDQTAKRGGRLKARR